MLSSQNKNGFTIIELLIVMAIAALIMVIVFLSVPALRRAATNHGRRDYVIRTEAALFEFKANTGHFPTCDSALTACSPATVAEATRFLQSYMPKGSDINDDPTPTTVIHSGTGMLYPDTDNIYFYYDSHHVNHSLTPPNGVIYIEAGHYCNTNDMDGTGDPVGGDDADINRIVVMIGFEHGYYFCADVGTH